MKNATRIENELFKKFDVKRGLRNEDGTGVLVGLTKIGNVVAQFLFSCCVIIILSASSFVNAKMRLVISQFEGILRIMLKS